MDTITGDLISMALDGQFDVIVHGCNCFNTMGKGIARQIKKEFPEAYAEDCTTKCGDAAKLGTITSVMTTRNGHQIIVVNAYTQYDYRGYGVHANYDAITLCFKEIKRQFAEKRIGYPKIGAGLACGDWQLIAPIIDEELLGENHTLVIWDKEP